MASLRMAGRLLVRLVAWLALAALQPVAQAQAVADPDWVLRLPGQERVAFVGALNLDKAGGPAGAMMYPAPNAAGLLVAILTHGVLAESSKNSEKERLRQEADKVLQPYQPVLENYAPRELVQQALRRLSPDRPRVPLETDAAAGRGLTLDILPVFSLTQDQAAIVLDTDVSIVNADPAGAAQPAYRNVVRVVSTVHAAPDLVAYWTANQGERLKEESAALLAESVRIALQQAAAAPQAQAPAFKTVRYNEGGIEKIERGQPLSVRCDRVLLKTLRGWLLSVPRRATDAAADAACAQAADVAAPQ